VGQGFSFVFGEGDLRGLFDRLMSVFRRHDRASPEARSAMRGRAPVDHVVLLDGTLGSLRSDRLTSIGIIYRFLRRAAPKASVYYGRGLQWREWHDTSDVWFGWGVNRQILRAYGWLAMRYHPGDRIFLIGYSRGAFAARSLAGMIERVGLLRAEAAIERNTQMAWRHYEGATPAPILHGFRDGLCHPSVRLEMVGAFDTVSALGVRLPFFWIWNERRAQFHDHLLGQSVHHGYQALALDETRSVLEPLIWDSEGTGASRIEQVWFRGCHGDIGGQLGHYEDSRPLANIPLVWMLEKAEALGLSLPPDWQDDFPRDANAASVGSWRGWGKYSLLRAPRVVGRDPSESLHESVPLAPPGGWRAILRPRLLYPKPAVPPASSASGGHHETGGGARSVEPPILSAPNLAARDSG